jgi:AcrR family transcriptional regulator
VDERRPGRREQQRAATMAEIRSTARRLLVERGPDAMTVNAVARGMGLSGPAIYRYYPSHDALVGAVIAELFVELTNAVAEVRDAHRDEPAGVRLLEMARATRAWAADRRAEFRLLFAVPIAESNRRSDAERQLAGEAFDRIFLEQFEALWQNEPFPVPELDQLDPSMRRQVTEYTAEKDTTLPPEAVHVFLSCWIRLYGLLVMEALDQLAFAYTDPEPLFEACLREIAENLGVEYRPPRSL